MTKTLIRLLKAFTVSAVAVYAFVNGPTIYANAQYWFQQIKPAEKTITTTYGGALIQPILLPVSDIDRRPLPSEATLTIEKINVRVPIVFSVSTNPQDIYNNLTNGVVHYSATPKPGGGAASVILGHSSLYPWQYNKYGAPFALLGKLAPGDRITVKYSDGRIFSYRMVESIVFNPLEADEDERLAAFEQSSQPLLLLVTCWPPNSTKSRIAIKAELE